MGLLGLLMDLSLKFLLGQLFFHTLNTGSHRERPDHLAWVGLLYIIEFVFKGDTLKTDLNNFCRDTRPHRVTFQSTAEDV